MTAVAAERFDLPRWVASATVVLGLHAAAVAMLLRWHDPVGFGEPSSAIVVDLSPYATPPSDSVEDLAPGPKQQQVEAPPPQEKPEPQTEARIEEKIDVAPEPDVAVPLPEPVKPTPDEVKPAPATTAPPRTHVSQAALDAWHRGVYLQIVRHKSYPPAARARRETGTVLLALSLDPKGRVVASSVAHSSGYAALDQEAIAITRRAEPFPVPPTGVAGERFDFTVPVEFGMR
jgi:protein TonB